MVNCLYIQQTVQVLLPVACKLQPVDSMLNLALFLFIQYQRDVDIRSSLIFVPGVYEA
jgi:hypothetical protein